MEDPKKKDQQEFIVETPIVIEEKLGKGTDKIRKYERGKFLGKGGFAKCFEMKCVDTNKIYAAKVFDKKALSNSRSKKKLINEIKLHKKLNHQNIVNFEHFFEDKDNVYILLELCSNQTLNDFLKRRKRLTELEVQCYLIQIIKALKYIHGHKIIHRDLKLGNLFITSKLELKLGDFGLAAKLEYEGQRRRTVCGTPNYIAPEILEKKNGHSFEVDIWSLGVVAYTLLFGRPPFETSDVKLTYKKIKMNNFSYPENIKVHHSAKKLITSILNLDPSKRPSLDEILDHEFFRIFNSVPINLPISTLACPPSHRYVSQFLKRDNNFNYINNSMTFNNTFSNHQKYKSNGNFINNEEYNINFNDLNSLNDLNHNINMNSVENFNFNDNMNKDIINRLLHTTDNTLHRKSESLNNFCDDKFLEKVNKILLNVGSNVVCGSRNNKGEGNFTVREKMISIREGAGKTIKEGKEENARGKQDVINPHPYSNSNSNTDYNQNIINNNFFINVANLNNMELKIDDSVLKKLEDVNLNPTTQNKNLQNNFDKKIASLSLSFNKITKFYDYTNKFGIIYFINNTHISICFNDNTNILKNVSLSVNHTDNPIDNFINSKNLQYLYIDKEGKTLNYDETGFESYINLNTGITGSKDLIKKFEIFKHILTKYTPEILALKGENNANKMFYVKKFLKVQHATLFRLSNKLIQVCFVDKTELIMSTESSEFFFKNKDGEEYQDSLQNVMNSDNHELIKRIKYSKNLLIHFVKSQKSKKNPMK